MVMNVTNLSIIFQANYTTVVLSKVWINYLPGNVKDEVL